MYYFLLLPDRAEWTEAPNIETRDPDKETTYMLISTIS
jgi:hypothetical protein